MIIKEKLLINNQVNSFKNWFRSRKFFFCFNLIASMDSMFYKQNIQLPVLKGALFPPEKAAEFLMRASVISSKSGFTWVYVDRPSGNNHCISQRWINVSIQGSDWNCRNS